MKDALLNSNSACKNSNETSGTWFPQDREAGLIVKDFSLKRAIIVTAISHTIYFTGFRKF